MKNIAMEKQIAGKPLTWDVEDVGDIVTKRPEFYQTAIDSNFDWMVDCYIAVDRHVLKDDFTQEERDDMKERIATTLSMLLMDPGMMEIKHGLEKKKKLLNIGQMP